MRKRFVAGVAVALLMASCGSKGRGGSSPAAARPTSTATLSIVEPADGAVVDGPAVHVKLVLDGGTIVPQTTTDIKPGEGHIHLSVDGTVVSMLSGVEEDLKDLESGTHLLRAEFVASDHAPFSPRVFEQRAFTLK
jgi:hypothetical protein